MAKVLSEAHRAAIRAAMNTPEVRARMSASHLGKLPTEATRAKLSEVRKGRPLAPQHRANVAVGARTPAKRALMARIMVGNTHAVDAPVKGDCVYCGTPARTWDHVIPRRRGGPDEASNKVPCCLRCNRSKGNLTPDEWLVVGLYRSSRIRRARFVAVEPALDLDEEVFEDTDGG